MDNIVNAGTVIKGLREEYDALNKLYALVWADNQRNMDLVEKLQDALAAALSDMKLAGAQTPCDVCANKLNDSDCDETDFDCENCAHGGECRCKECDGTCSEFVWRGIQEEGAGE